MLIGVIAEELLSVLVEPVIEPASAIDNVDGYFAGAPIGLLSEAATAADIANALLVYGVAIAEAATATSVQEGGITGAAATRSAMLPKAFVNSDTSREANVVGTMVNL